MDHSPQGSVAFAVNDAYLEDAPLPTGGQIVRHQILHFTRPEGMQVQDAIDREFDRVALLCVLCHIFSLKERVERQRLGPSGAWNDDNAP
jgi:hypothetical protein